MGDLRTKCVTMLRENAQQYSEIGVEIGFEISESKEMTSGAERCDSAGLEEANELTERVYDVEVSALAEVHSKLTGRMSNSETSTFTPLKVNSEQTSDSAK